MAETQLLEHLRVSISKLWSGARNVNWTQILLNRIHTLTFTHTYTHFIWKAETEKDLSSVALLPKSLPYLGLDQEKARSSESNPSLPCGWQESKYLSLLECALPGSWIKSGAGDQSGGLVARVFTLHEPRSQRDICVYILSTSFLSIKAL